MDTVTLNVQGMTCGGCVASVTRVLKAVSGVGEVDVTLDSGTARVVFDPAKADIAKLKDAVEGAGYDVTP